MDSGFFAQWLICFDRRPLVKMWSSRSSAHLSLGSAPAQEGHILWCKAQNVFCTHTRKVMMLTHKEKMFKDENTVCLLLKTSTYYYVARVENS